jgi:DNA repair photolyase
VFVRWASQQVESDNAGRLPGYTDSVVRTFDAPEALNIRFHEVRTKSALNPVPAASRLPFAWTVNPYRGCTHACAYCLAGDTPILLADGTTRPLAALREGDRIYGTRTEGRSRRYVITEVLAHWHTRKPAFRVTLDDGTELITSADHRFLTPRGFKHVVSDHESLVPGDRLLGPGGFAPPPRIDDDHRRGYLCGLTRGEPVREPADILARAATEPEIHARAQSYLTALGLTSAAQPRLARAHGASFAAAPAHATSAGGAAPARAAAPTRGAAPGEDLARLVAWPWEPSEAWSAGFLAGIYDVDGRYARGMLRIANTDPAIIQRAADCLRRLGFQFVIEDRGLEHALRAVRVLGGTAEHLRFFQVVGPAVGAKRSVVGRAVKPGGRVVAIEPLGFELPMYDITTGTGDFIANGVVSHNCFARPTHEYLDLGAGRDFEREIVVKVNVPEVLRAELARPSWTGETVALGTNTDPYQWVEGRYKLMRGIWEAFRDHRNPCSILTKSPLLLRDLDLLRQIRRTGADVSACLSVPTLDEKAWRATEPHTPHPRARLEAVAELNRNGIPTGVLIAPLMPGINDAYEQVAKIVELATAAKATYIGGQTLFLRGPVRTLFFEWLHEHRPDLVPRYERLYAKSGYLSAPERHKIEVAAGAPWLRRMDRDPYRARHRGGMRRPAQPPLMPTPTARPPKQERLF